MEPKVVQQCLDQRQASSQGAQWTYSSKLAYYKQGGSGNNWALGYKYLGDQEYYEVHSRIQSLLEKQDYFQGFHVLKSLAGGTGSGLGAHLIERMRDDYSRSMILTTAIWPYSKGEVILQNYNVLLTLASSLEHATGILPLYNDQILLTCRELLKEVRPSYKTMNTVIAQSLLGFLFPCSNHPKTGTIPLFNSSGFAAGPLNVLSEMQEHLLTHQSDYYKLLTVKNIPQCNAKVSEFNTDLWEGMVSRIRQMLIANNSEHQINWSVKLGDSSRGGFGGQKPLKSIGNMLFMRGDGVFDKQNMSYDQRLFGHGHPSQESTAMYTNQTDFCFASGLRTYRDPLWLFGREKNLCVLSNNQSHVEPLERTLRKGTQMRIAKAFLHHYAKFGVESDDISAAFLKCEETLLAYKLL